MFNPQTEYTVIPRAIRIQEFHQYREDFVIRPPYQRKNVWSRKKQQDLLDSLFRRYYIPRIVIREVRLSKDRTIQEVIDGQQRISTVQAFFADELRLPQSLSDIHVELAGKVYSQLPSELRRFVDSELLYDADIVKGIDDPQNPKHQNIAAEIFWRLQQGESLNYMEIAHARLSSLIRNFIVKYGDDYDFDYKAYQSVDHNPHKHSFFKIYDRDNRRMQHLALLARLILIEKANGPTETKDTQVAALIDETQADEGIGNLAFENTSEAKAVLRTLDLLYKIFKNDPMLDEQSGIKEFRIEYFVISIYLLLRHVSKYYVFDEREKELFREFTLHFHERWSSKRENDNDILLFSDNRQQSKAETEFRDRLLRQAFFNYVEERGHQMLSKDGRRAFNEAERIQIYRRYIGMCQMCISEGKPERECLVSWSEYEADHVIPHSKGGLTDISNAQLLCRYHNQQKGAWS